MTATFAVYGTPASLAQLNQLSRTSPPAATGLAVADFHGTHLAHKIRHEFALEDE